MKSIKPIALSAVLMLGVFCAILYPSCSKDACKAVTCLNGATCSGGSCAPCPSGIGGVDCEIVYRVLYANTYVGVATYSANLVDSATGADSSYIIRVDTGNTLTFSVGPDSVYTQIQLVWNRPGRNAVSFPNAILANSSANGSTYTVAGADDTVNYTGTGNINNSSASLNLVGTHAVGPPIIVTLNNFTNIQ